MENLKIELTKSPKQKPTDESNLGFGKIFTDHMLIIDYSTENGWHNARIEPFGNISLSPAAMCLHYGQEVFEGMKAYRTADNRIMLFRPEENFKRMNVSNERLVIPQIDEDFALKALVELIKVDKDWIPHSDGSSLYIRPFIIAADEFLGVAPSKTYRFITILSPSGAYYATGLNPVGIYVEKNYVRAVKGGMGYTKTGGNYAASLIAQDEAHREGFGQVLWLDGVERKYIEEVGAMNIFFIIDGEVVTPELQGSILPGITRKSVLDLARHWGMKVTEKRISIEEVYDAYKAGKLTEVFGTGTAAVISPVGLLKWGDVEMKINNNEIGEVSAKLYDTITGIQWGKIKDEFNWTLEIK
jgi:branched-chain amino acid aminotransferase